MDTGKNDILRTHALRSAPSAPRLGPRLGIAGFAATASLLALSVSALSVSAFAQDAAAQEDAESGNTVIIVTAQKRAQDIQDVPISIAAFDIDSLEANRLEGVEDLGRLVPGVYVTPNPADNNGVRLNIRGIGTFDPQIGQDSRIAVYVDGIYYGKTQGLAFDSPDLERVEVLKGPQGTLYGRNSVAGAVNLISAKPNADEFSGKITAEYGRFNRFKLSGAVNIPIGEVAGFRVSGSYARQDGWVENEGSGVDFGGGNQYNFRVAFGAEITPDIRFDIAADLNKVKNEPLFYQSLPGTANPGALFAAAVGTARGRQNTVTTAFANEEGDLETKGISANLEWDFSENHRMKFTAAYRRADSNRFVTLVPTANPQILAGILNADIIDAVPGVQSFNGLISGTALAFQLAGQPLRSDFATAFNRAPGPQTGLFLSDVGGAATLDGHKQFSLEATFNGELADGKLEYTLGGYYYDEKTGTDVLGQGNRADVNSYLFVLAGFDPRIMAPIPAAALAAGGLAATLNNPNVPQSVKDGLIAQSLTPSVGDVNAARPNPTTLVSLYSEARQSAANDLRIQSTAFAFYGELTWNVSERFRITGGLRYSDESKDGQGQAKSPFFLDTMNLLGQVIDPNVGAIDFDVLNPSLVLEYDATDTVLLYASYKESFRSGGFNSGAIGPRVQGQTFGADFLFDRENIKAYEAGFKADIADNRVRINAASFYYDFKDQQTTVALNPLIATARAVVNTDEEIWGFEIDTLFYVSNHLSINASYSYIDGNAGDVTNPLTMQVELREEIQGTPKNSFLIGFNYTRPLSDSVVLFASSDYSYKDDVLSIPQNALRLTSQNIVNGRFGVTIETSNGTKFSVSVWGQNILDDKYTIDTLPFNTFAYTTEVFGQPATYGITAGIKF